MILMRKDLIEQKRALAGVTRNEESSLLLATFILKNPERKCLTVPKSGAKEKGIKRSVKDRKKLGETQSTELDRKVNAPAAGLDHLNCQIANVWRFDQNI
jgi:hypothetical protein